MELIYILTRLTIYPLDYLLWWLFYSWLIWLLLRWRNWPKPTLSVMLILSTAVAIFYIHASQRAAACIELCFPSFSLFPFISASSFWFIVLYIPIALASKTKAIFDQIRRNWWITFFMTALGGGYISVELSGTIHSMEYFDLSASDIFSDILFYPAMGILLPWAFWLLLKFFSWNRLTLPTMLIYSISLVNVFLQLWFEALLHGRFSSAFFSLSRFLAEVAMWFAALYILMRLTVRIERQVTN